MGKKRRKLRNLIVAATIGTTAAVFSPVGRVAYAKSSPVPERHYARSHTIKNSMVHNHRGGHKLVKHRVST